MSEKYQNYTDGRIEIDLIDMMLALLSHWKSFLLAVGVGILLGCGLYVLQKPTEVIAPEVIKEYEPTEDEQEAMEMAAEYRRLYESQLAYKQNSVLMQMDSDHIYEGKLSYYLSAGSNTEYISLLYQNFVNSNEVLGKLKAEAELDCDDKYMKELFTCSTVKGEDFYIDGNTSIFLESGNYVIQNVTLNFKIIYDDPSVCTDMLKILSDEVAKLDEECTGIYSNYGLKEICNEVTQSVRPDVLTAQKNCMDTLGVYQTSIAKYEDAFSEDTLAYYEAEYLGKTVNEIEEIEEVTAQTGLSIADLLKWIIVGVVLLCVCWTAVWVFQYIYDKRIKISANLQDAFQIAIVGRLDAPCVTKCRFDNWVAHLRKKHAHISDDMEYVVYSLLAMGKSKIVLGGNNNSIVEQMISALKENHMDVLEVGYIHRNRNVLEKAKESEGMVLVIRLNEDTYDEIQRELSICRIQNIPVLGAIAVGA